MAMPALVVANVLIGTMMAILIVIMIIIVVVSLMMYFIRSVGTVDLMARVLDARISHMIILVLAALRIISTFVVVNDASNIYIFNEHLFLRHETK